VEKPHFLIGIPLGRRSVLWAVLRLAGADMGVDVDKGGLMVEYQLGAGVRQRMTVGSLWQAMSGRPLSADLLDCPPDLFRTFSR
jgi:hypothetical protein